MMQWFKWHYLANDADARQPTSSPLLADDLSGLPPATVITAERLREAGVPVTWRRFDGVMREFFGMAAVIDEAKDAVKLAADACEPRSRARSGRRELPRTCIKSIAEGTRPTIPLLRASPCKSCHGRELCREGLGEAPGGCPASPKVLLCGNYRTRMWPTAASKED
jgi:hypothetical protein